MAAMRRRRDVGGRDDGRRRGRRVGRVSVAEDTTQQAVAMTAAPAIRGRPM